MARFYFRGVDSDGAVDQGVIESASKSDAYTDLTARGVTIFDLSDTPDQAATTHWYLRDIRFGSERLSSGRQSAVAEQMSLLFGAHLPITEVLRVLEASAETAPLRRHFARTAQGVADGIRFDAAFAEVNRGFSPIFVRLLALGQSTNRLAEILPQLAQFLRDQDQIRGKVTGALIYPAILVTSACILAGVVTFYLTPTLVPLFSSMGRPLPGSLSILLTIEMALRRAAPVLLPATACLGLGIMLLLRVRSERMRLKSLAMRLPFMGPVMRGAALMRLSWALGLMLKSGAALPIALRDVATIMDQEPFARVFAEAAEALEQGGRAASAISAHTMIPLTYKELFRVGEDTNRLPEILESLSEILRSDVERGTQRILTLLTPLLTLLLGSGIGALIYVIMGAMLEVNTLAF